MDTAGRKGEIRTRLADITGPEPGGRAARDGSVPDPDLTLGRVGAELAQVMPLLLRSADRTCRELFSRHSSTVIAFSTSRPRLSTVSKSIAVRRTSTASWTSGDAGLRLGSRIPMLGDVVEIVRALAVSDRHGVDHRLLVLVARQALVELLQHARRDGDGTELGRHRGDLDLPVRLELQLPTQLADQRPDAGTAGERDRAGQLENVEEGLDAGLQGLVEQLPLGDRRGVAGHRVPDRRPQLLGRDRIRQVERLGAALGVHDRAFGLDLQRATASRMSGSSSTTSTTGRVPPR